MNRFKAQGFPDGLALGPFLGIEGSLGLFWLLANIDEDSGGIIFSLAASAMTLLAAYVALHGSFRIVATSREIAEKEKQAKKEAARASLPLVVSSLYSLCENRIYFYVDAKSHRKAGHWSLDDQLIGYMRDCVEAIDGDVREVITEIIAVYQICVARSEDTKVEHKLSDPRVEKWECYDRGRRILDWITLQALCETLFDYSRKRTEGVDRLSVPDRARKRIDFLESDGWVITNRQEVQELFERELADDDFGFALPDWRLR